MAKLAVVTGANKGIGFEICRELAKNGVEVILTARNEDKGKQAEQDLKEQGLNVVFYKMDITDENSIKGLADFIENKYGKLDILINNAGIFKDYEGGVLQGDINNIKETMDTNFYGALLVSRYLVPLMQKQNYGRVINISSGMGQLSDMGGGSIGYRISKTALNAMTKILANEVKNNNILVNTMCPGWVKTDMGGANAHRTVEQGADTAVWLAISDENDQTGKFFRDRKEISW